MPEPSDLDAQIIAAERDLVTSENHPAARRRAAGTLDGLNARKLLGAIQERDADTRARSLLGQPS